MDVKRKNKVLDTEIVKKCMQLEKQVLTRSHQWKKQFKYDLCQDYVKNVKCLRESVVIALTIDHDFPEEKIYNYNIAKSALNNAEVDLMMMSSNEFKIIGYGECADYCILIDDISSMVDKLVNYIKKDKNKVKDIKNIDLNNQYMDVAK